MAPMNTPINRRHSRIDEIFASCSPPKDAENPYAHMFMQLCQPELFDHLKSLGYLPINKVQERNITHWTFQGGNTYLRIFPRSGDVCIAPGSNSPIPISKLEKTLRDLHLHPMSASFGSNGKGISDYGRIN